MTNRVPHHILTVTVENKPGVLSRVAGLFSRRAFNIVSLAVSPTDDERFSRMTIVVDAEVTWNYTTWLNIAFLGLATALVWRFFKTGGRQMLRMMNKPIDETDEHRRGDGDHHPGRGHRHGEGAAPA